MEELSAGHWRFGCGSRSGDKWTGHGGPALPVSHWPRFRMHHNKAVPPYGSLTTAGLPAAMTPGGIMPVTTEEAPMTAVSPISTPLRMVVLAPRKTNLPMEMGEI